MFDKLALFNIEKRAWYSGDDLHPDHWVVAFEEAKFFNNQVSIDNELKILTDEEYKIYTKKVSIVPIFFAPDFLRSNCCKGR